MPKRPSLRKPQLLKTIRNQRAERSKRVLALRSVRESILSLAGLIGAPVKNQAGSEVGKVVDVVARWSDDSLYPPVTGLIAKVGSRPVFIGVANVESIRQDSVVLRTARMDLMDFKRRHGEVRLAKDVLDHQLVDVDGVQVIRAADLYLATLLGRVCLVGADVSMNTILRRLLPAKLRKKPTPEQVVDWSSIQPFGDEKQAGVRLRTSHEGLKRLRPGELADLLEDLGRPARQELLASLEPETAADALEEMDPEELGALLRESEPEQAANLLTNMETDEAVDALRDLGNVEREEIYSHMDEERVGQLSELLEYPQDSAGGFMNTLLVTTPADSTVGEVRSTLSEMADHKCDIDAVTVVGEDGRFLGDVPLFDLVVADDSAKLADFGIGDGTVTVLADAALDEVAHQLIESRRSSIVVLSSEGVPLGRILADDIVDALLPERGKFHFPRLLK